MTGARMSPGGAMRLSLAALVFHIVLIQPNHPAALGWGALLVFPLELPVILLGLIALPQGRWSRSLRGVLVAALSVIVVLKMADFAMFTSLSRGFNPVADIALIEAAWRLSAGAMGTPLTLLALLSALGAVIGLGALLWWASGVWARVARPTVTAVGASMATFFFAGVAAAEVGQAMGRWALPVTPPGAAFTARVGVERVEMARDTLADLRAFEAAAADDPYAARSDFLQTVDRDVLILFVESYGRTSLDTPFYADMHRGTLTDAQSRLEQAGLAMRSGFLSAPTRGGQSWLSHATFANGLWVADQTSYGAVLASGRLSLFHLAGRAGFHTAAVMPQITLDWPEADLMGFETVLVAADLGYEGASFNWVTMPDQFTLASLDRLLRQGAPDRRLFAQVALGSSHAPWVPVPELVPWEDVGDGRIFTPMAEGGDPPDVVWRDRSRVRAQYRLAVDYALQVVFDYAARHAQDPPLVFIIGDHQAASFVALDERPDVPVHVIGPTHLVDVAADWGWVAGLIPDENGQVRPMSEMRNLLLQGYSAPNDAGADS